MAIAEKMPTVVAERSAWLETIEALLSEVETWASHQSWPTHRRSKDFAEEPLSDDAQKKYTVPVLEIAVPSQVPARGRDEKIILEPIMFNPSTGIIRVDFYAWPALYRLRMIRSSNESQWIIKTDSGIDWPLPWNEQTFVQIAQGLSKA
jgi:hypothetical protein